MQKNQFESNIQYHQNQQYINPFSQFPIFQQANLQKRAAKIKRKSSSKIIESEGKGKWTKQQQKIYIKFMQENLKQMDSKILRKSQKVFMNMSKAVKTRSADQCRSHHQKILKHHGNSLEEIILQYKQHLFGKQIKQQMNRGTQIQSNNPFCTIYRISNRFRIQIDSQCIQEYNQ